MDFRSPRPPCLLFASERPLSAAAPGVRGSRIRRPVRSLRRHARAMACGVLGLAAVALATPAAAQPASAYESVSNLQQSPVGHVFAVADHSQRFTTGSNSGGYSLYNVVIRTSDDRTTGVDIATGQYVLGDFICSGDELFLGENPLSDPSCSWVANPFSVSVCRVLASGDPDRDSCTLLNPPSSFVPGNLFFTAPAVDDPSGSDVEKIELAPNTTYTLLTEVGQVVGDGVEIPLAVSYAVTDSDNENANSSPGWSIWDDYDSHNAHDDIWGPHYAQAHRVQIRATRGHALAVITSVDVTSSSSHPPLHGPSDIIEFTVTLSEDVTVGGDPVFLFSLGGDDTEASYDAERSTATSLVFKYTVQDDDKVTDGIQVGNGPRTFRLDDNDHIRTLRNSQDALLDHDALGTLLDAPATVQTLVSNFGQPSTAERQLHVGPDNPVAHAFTTGSNSAGYGLDSIRINVTRVVRRPENFFASIWTTAGGIPQTKQFGLTIPVSITNNSTGNKTFTAPPNTTLNASTTYALVLSAWEGNIVLDRVATRAEDAGRAPGWSIANTVYSKASRWYPAIGYPIRIEVKGTILPDPADATLSALALSAAADDSSIALSPPFASSITNYTASVANGVDAITIAPTPTNNGASVRQGIEYYLDGSDMPIPDADATKNHQQVSLAAGANTIKVKVTSADGDTTKTYTVTVTRTPASAQARVTEAEVTEAEVTEAEATVIEAEATVTSTPQLTSDTYGVDEPIEFTVTFSEAVKVEGDPEFRFSLGNAGQTRVAAYDADRSTATELVFKYEVQARDEDTDGIWVGDHTQTFSPDANIRTTSNNATAILTHSPLGILTGHKVDGPGAPPPPPLTVTGSSGGSTKGGGSGGGGGSPSQDEHGNTPAQATPVTLDPARTASVPGQLNTAADVDYFTVDVPHAGAVVVETTGSTATMGTVWQAGEELATADSGGVRQNFRLRVRVAPGPVVIAVAGNGRQTGRYTLQVTLLPGYLENPGPHSFQSGIGVISGWVCAAEEVEIELNGEPQEAAYGTERLDTAGVCGDTDNGFGLLFNWNLLEDGEHEVVAVADGVELDRATVTVTTLGAEFLRDVTGTCTAADFPTGDETVTLAWQQTQQNFVIVDGAAPAGATQAGRAGVGYLENPGPHSFQSGIGVISGWVCEGAEVIIELNGEPQPAAYGTERLDTLEVCDDTDNGFGLLFNWNLLGDGEHEVVALVDGEELGRATVRVTTVGEGAEAEFLRGAEGECVVEDFPMPGETVTLEWQQNSQNFVITDVE